VIRTKPDLNLSISWEKAALIPCIIHKFYNTKIMKKCTYGCKWLELALWSRMRINVKQQQHKLEFVVIYKKNNQKMISHLTKTETSPVMWLNTVIIVAWNVHLLPAHMYEDGHATHQLHCQWWSGQYHARHVANTASVHQCCAPMTDKLAAGRCPISCNRQGRGQDCSEATDPVEVVQCQICQNSNF